MFEPLTALVLLALIVLAPAGVFLVFRPRLRRVAAERLTRDGRAGVVGPAVTAFAVVQLLAVAVAGIGAFSVAYPRVMDLGLVRKIAVEIASEPSGMVTIDGRSYGTTPMVAELHRGLRRIKVDGVQGYLPYDTSLQLRTGGAYSLKLRRAPIRSTKVDQSPAHIRSGPGASFDSLWTVGKGYSLDVLAVQGEWYEVRLPDGTEGWVNRRFTEDATGSLRINSDPEGAVVLLDGVRLGTTPLVTGSIQEGARRMLVQMPGVRGYRQVDTIIQVRGRSESNLGRISLAGPDSTYFHNCLDQPASLEVPGIGTISLQPGETKARLIPASRFPLRNIEVFVEGKRSPGWTLNQSPREAKTASDGSKLFTSSLFGIDSRVLE